VSLFSTVNYFKSKQQWYNIILNETNAAYFIKIFWQTKYTTDKIKKISVNFLRPPSPWEKIVYSWPMNILLSWHMNAYKTLTTKCWQAKMVSHPWYKVSDVPIKDSLLQKKFILKMFNT